VLPSLEEGFGLPVVEAMAAGLPVVCSSHSALAEVSGDAALLVDCHDATAISRAVERVLDDRALAESLRAKGLARSRLFEWTDTAARTLAFYRTLLGR
jgi:alpha-1,3-rhamnosyl/mannosyltransferase